MISLVGVVVQLGNWLKSQKKARKDRKLDKNKSDRFKALIETGKLRWKPDLNIVHDQSDAVRISQSLPFNLDFTSSIPSSSAAASVSSSIYQTNFSNYYTPPIDYLPTSSTSSSSLNLLPPSSSSPSSSPSPSLLTFSEIKGSWILAFEALVSQR